MDKLITIILEFNTQQVQLNEKNDIIVGVLGFWGVGPLQSDCE